jgi:hypothetical protein
MLVGVGVLFWLKRSGREEWIAKAGEIVEERVETPEERAAKSVL